MLQINANTGRSRNVYRKPYSGEAAKPQNELHQKYVKFLGVFEELERNHKQNYQPKIILRGLPECNKNFQRQFDFN